jgi:hypothetical protein
MIIIIKLFNYKVKLYKVSYKLYIYNRDFNKKVYKKRIN